MPTATIQAERRVGSKSTNAKSGAAPKPASQPPSHAAAPERVEGRGLEVSTLTVREANGDVSTTRFAAVDTQKKYTDAEADRLFRVPPG